MKKRALFAAAITVIWAGTARSEEIAGIGLGNYTCAQFAKAYRVSGGSDAVETSFFIWAQGFMTGWNIAVGDQKVFRIDLSAMKYDAQKKFVRDYCDKHPLKTYLEAVMALQAQMKYLKPGNSN